MTLLLKFNVNSDIIRFSVYQSIFIAALSEVFKFLQQTLTRYSPFNSKMTKWFWWRLTAGEQVDKTFIKREGGNGEVKAIFVQRNDAGKNSL